MLRGTLHIYYQVRRLLSLVMRFFLTYCTVHPAASWIYMFSSTFRYDLADTVGIGLVTFSNTSRLEFPLTPVNEATRSRLADSVPDKYR